MTDWIDLSRPIAREMPGTPAQPDPSFETVFDIDEDGMNIQYICTASHSGMTHIDAPIHFDPDGVTIEKLSVDRFVAEAVVLDVHATEPRPIERSELADAEPTVRADDVVMLSTGWEHKYGDDEYNPWPYLTLEAAEWLVEREAAMLCVDTTSPDMARGDRPEDWWYPVHRTLLGNEVLIAEHLQNLEDLVGTRFDVIGLPVAIEGGDAAPARFVADADSIR